MIKSLLPFERPRKVYRLVPDKASREKTFSLLLKIKGYCKKEIEVTACKSRKEKLSKISDAVDKATKYLEDNKTRSNVRIARFYRFLSLPQKKTLIKAGLLTLNDLSKKTQVDLSTLLRYRTHSGEYASPTFITILGK